MAAKTDWTQIAVRRSTSELAGNLAAMVEQERHSASRVSKADAINQALYEAIERRNARRARVCQT